LDNNNKDRAGLVGPQDWSSGGAGGDVDNGFHHFGVTVVLC
jgi:hypothetical protein